MKQRIYLFVVCLCAILSANAQISITLPPSSQFIEVDTFARATNLSGYASYATPQTNATWDFSGVTYPTNGFIYERENPTSANYPGTTYSTGTFYPFAGGLSYSVTRYAKASASSLFFVGEELPVQQTLSLAAATGGANDKLVFPSQVIKYSSEQFVFKYPVTLGSTWSSTYSSTTKFNLTIAAYSLNDVPGERKSFRVFTDSVVGWGTAKVKSWKDGKIYNIPVLQARYVETYTDSFYLGGSPAPAQLLAAFGLQQGVAQKFYYVHFLRQGEVEEFITIDYINSNYQTVGDLFIMQDRLEQGSLGIKETSVNNAISVYPNPIQNNEITLLLSNNNVANVTYEVADIYGRKIISGSIGGNATISLPTGIAQGNYVLTIKQDGVIVSINKILKQE